jgi:hypothetical protein
MSWERMEMSKDQGRLGFKDLSTFNKALLAKKLWRIIQNPESLAAKILKAKYFPNSSLWEAGLGNRPSLAWRSILSANELLQSGTLWRVGDRSQVHSQYTT